ncbi:hypothetical protein SDC9_132864 [bioreactor metagenome]|uniref:Uncharacterized protein n=1 Tax=bioreactor metagenome TaxID=1076179 RepID=A0A645DB31_9ZZZZ
MIESVSFVAPLILLFLPTILQQLLELLFALPMFVGSLLSLADTDVLSISIHFRQLLVLALNRHIDRVIRLIILLSIFDIFQVPVGLPSIVLLLAGFPLLFYQHLLLN